MPQCALDEQVDRLGGAVAGPAGGEVGEDLVLPGGDGASEAVELGHGAVGAGQVEAFQPPAGPVEVGGGVEGAQLLAGDPRGGDLPVGVPGAEPGEQAG